MRPLACDAVLIENGAVLLVKRARGPSLGMWALPGGHINGGETAEACLKREMMEETGLGVEPVRLVGVYSDPGRDPRKTISLAYLVRRTGGSPRAGDDAGEASWHPLGALPKLAFDHARILADALALKMK